MQGHGSDEQRIAAYVRGELSPSERLEVEAMLDENPEWLAVVAVLARAKPDATETADEPRDFEGGVLLPGTRVGRYALGTVLGRGASGVVYAAWDPDLRRDVALKLVAPTLLGRNDRAQARLRREAKALARVEDPHVVQIFDVGTWRGQLFIAMERLNGGTLDDWRQSGSMSWREVVRRWIDAGQGLEAAHRDGVIHRDFKPSNVMLDEEGRVVVVDFGLARDTGPDPTGSSDEDAVEPALLSPRLDSDAITHTGTALGTPAFMAPEQRSGASVGTAADQYSFCTTLLEALTGRLPSGVQRVELPPLSDRPPARLRRVLWKGLAPTPADRYRDMGELLGALRAAHNDRNRWIAGAGLVAFMVALGGWIGTRETCVPDPPLAGLDAATQRLVDATEALDATATARSVTWSGWERDWLRAHAWACRAHEEQALDAGQFDRVALCLDAQRQRVRSMLEDLAGRPGFHPQAATAVLASVPAIEDCRSVRDDPGYDPQLRPLVLELEDGLAMLKSARLAGGPPPIEQGEALLARADAIGVQRWRAFIRLEFAVSLELGGQFERAATLYREGSEIAESEGLAEFAALLLIRRAALVGMTMRRVDEGISMLEHAESWTRRTEVDPHVEADRLLTLAEVLRVGAQLDRAQAVLDQAKVAIERVDPDHPTRPDSEVQLETALGTLAYLRGNDEEAQRRFETALALQLQRVDEDHVTVLQIRNNLAGVLRNRGELAQALAVFRDNLEVLEAARAPSDIMTQMARINLALVEVDAGAYGAAFLHASAAIDQLRAQGPQGAGPLMGNALASRAESELGLGRWERARIDAEEAEQILRLEYGEGHPEVAETGVAVGRALLGLGQVSAARERLASAHDALHEAWSPEDSRLVTVLVHLGRAAEAAQDPDDAREHYDRAVALSGPSNRGWANLRRGSLARSRGDRTTALTYLESAVEWYDARVAPPRQHAEALLTLAQTLHELRRTPERVSALALRARDLSLAADDPAGAREAEQLLPAASR